MPLVSVTMTSSLPAVVAAVLALISVEDSTSTSVVSLPILTFAPVVNPVPVITTSVAPVVGPLAGSIFVTVGGVTYVYSTLEPELTPPSVTTTGTAPAACAGVFAVISVSPTTTTEVAVEPIVTVAPLRNPVPLT